MNLYLCYVIKFLQLFEINFMNKIKFVLTDFIITIMILVNLGGGRR